MKNVIVSSRDTVVDNRRNPLHQLDLASQHCMMQVLGWMGSLVFSLTFLSIFHFGFTWMAYALVFGGIALTVSVFRESENQRALAVAPASEFGAASKCIWKLDSEA